jgi:hypothetical protein
MAETGVMQIASEEVVDERRTQWPAERGLERGGTPGKAAAER